MSELPEIINWRRFDVNTTLSGQPTEEQLSRIQDLAVTHIINLAPHSDSGSLQDEKSSVESLGMTYIHIPVDFEHPTDADFAQFSDVLKAKEGLKIHVHCMYNARVTAFVYRYAKSTNSTAEAYAFGLMDGIWRPGGAWAKFIDNQAAIDQPHLYAGRDY